MTASPYEAQDYEDNGEDIVEKILMPEGLIAWSGTLPRPTTPKRNSRNAAATG